MHVCVGDIRYIRYCQYYNTYTQDEIGPVAYTRSITDTTRILNYTLTLGVHFSVLILEFFI